MWLNMLQPSINQGPWTKSEDKKLKELVAASKERNWDVISKELESGRTPFQSFHRFEFS